MISVICEKMNIYDYKTKFNVGDEIDFHNMSWDIAIVCCRKYRKVGEK